MDKYEYLTGKYLGYKPGVAERAKFEYCTLGEVLSGKVKKDKQNNKTDEIVKMTKTNKFWLIINSTALQNLKILVLLKNCQVILCKENWMSSIKLTMSKKFNPQRKEKKDLKEKIKDNAGDIFNELYYIYKERYSEEKTSLNTQDTKKFD